MRQIIVPSNTLKKRMDSLRPKIVDCVAAFHIRRGTLADDSKQFGFLPFASDEAIESMIKEANRLGEPVYVHSDSESTKSYFLKNVPRAISLEVPIGFTSDEHSQRQIVENENVATKMNSFAEWFLLSEMPIIYMTAGGINGRNVDSVVEEGITSTFGYSAALYGGKIPHYVFNDGFIFYPDGKNGPNHRYSWSDM
jgi:hypothetical protein